MRYFALFVAMMLLAGCSAVDEGRATRAFFRDYRGEFKVEGLRLFETIEYQNKGEKRYRFVGGFSQPEYNRWAVVWSDYGQVRPHQWRVLKYPEQPFAYAGDRSAAAREAAEYRAAFEQKLVAGEE